MSYGQLRKHDHDLDNNYRPRRARELVDRGASNTRSPCWPVAASAAAICLFVQHFVNRSIVIA